MNADEGWHGDDSKLKKDSKTALEIKSRGKMQLCEKFETSSTLPKKHTNVHTNVDRACDADSDVKKSFRDKVVLDSGEVQAIRNGVEKHSTTENGIGGDEKPYTSPIGTKSDIKNIKPCDNRQMEISNATLCTATKRDKCRSDDDSHVSDDGVQGLCTGTGIGGSRSDTKPPSERLRLDADTREQMHGDKMSLHLQTYDPGTMTGEKFYTPNNFDECDAMRASSILENVPGAEHVDGDGTRSRKTLSETCDKNTATGENDDDDDEKAIKKGDGEWSKRHKFALSPNLLHWKDMPRHLQFNPYIFTGYRPLLSIWGCIHSLFYWHNETINIFTHGIPIVYILVSVPRALPWGDAETRFLSWCHLLGSVAPWVGSFVYHLFMNLERGASVYYRLLQLDMLGIWISQSFGAMPMVVATVYCLPRILSWLCISTYCILSLWGLYKAMTAWSPWERRLCFMLPFTMRVLLGGLRASSLGGGDPASLTHVFLQDAVSIFGGAIGALHIPEKWFPGSVDLYLNSHNIMHVLVVMAVYSMHQATVRDLAWMSRVQCRLAAATVNSSGSVLDLPVLHTPDL